MTNKKCKTCGAKIEDVENEHESCDNEKKKSDKFKQDLARGMI